MPQQLSQDKLIAMLAWQAEMGADEALMDKSSRHPQDRLSLHDISGSGRLISGPIGNSALTSIQPHTAKSVALDHINNLSDLAAALGQLDSCPLKHTASNMCFSDGNEGARLMIIGEAPGRDEDQLGVPFVGAVGQFLDRMLASIGLNRSGVYLTNFLPWRPPGNRSATAEEIDMLLPFLHRHIQLANPEIVVVLVGTPAKTI